MYIFDGHSDLWMDVDRSRNRGIQSVISDTHIDRWSKGHIKGGFYPIWVDPNSDVSVELQAKSLIKNMSDELKDSAKYMRLVCNSKEYETVLGENRQAVFIGAEGLSFIGEDIDQIDYLYNIGFREMSLTWNETNLLATGAHGSLETGLTKKGKDAISRMMKLGIILDLAHSNARTFWDSISLIDKPFMVSHGSCYSLCPHPRNFTDEQIKCIAKYNGVIGLCSYAPFIANEEEFRTIKQYVTHLSYVSDLVGVDHVALGFDFVDFLEEAQNGNELDYKIKGFETIKKTDAVLEEMKNQGFSQIEIDKICHGNFERLIKTLLS